MCPIIRYGEYGREDSIKEKACARGALFLEKTKIEVVFPAIGPVDRLRGPQIHTSLSQEEKIWWCEV